MKRQYMLTWSIFFLALEPSDKHVNYLNPSIPPHLLNSVSTWILSHPLDSFSVIQRCVFFKCLSAADFELWMPQAPRRDLRGPAVWPSIYHILPAAMKRQTPSNTHIMSIDPINSPMKPRASLIALRLSLCVEKKIILQHFKRVWFSHMANMRRELSMLEFELL